jgi:hypothetical protein
MRAVKNGTAQTVTNGSDAVVTLIDDFDPQGWFASNKFQPTIAGYYNIDVSVWWDAGAVTNNQTNIQLRKNGTTQLAIDQAQIVTGAGYGQTLSTIVYFNGSTDYVEVTAFTGNTTSQNINGAAGGTYIVANLIAYGNTGPQGPSGPSGPSGPAGSGGGGYVFVTANGASQVNSSNINFVNTASVTVSVTTDANGNANIAFTSTGGGGGGASVGVADSPPPTPDANSLWWDSNTGVLKIYYSDGTSSQWVDASPVGVGPTGPSGATGPQGPSGPSGPSGPGGDVGSAYAQANAAYDAANSAAQTVRISQNNSSILSSKQLNFVNTATVTVSVTDSGNGNANIVFTSSAAATMNSNVSNAVAVTVNTTTPTSICNVTIAVSGTKKIMIVATGDGNPNQTGGWHNLALYRDGTLIGKAIINENGGGSSKNCPWALCHLDQPTAGTRTYEVRAWQGSGSFTYGEVGDSQAPTILAVEIL